MEPRWQRAYLSGNIRTTEGVLRIGGNSVWGEWFHGLIDEVRVYDRALVSAGNSRRTEQTAARRLPNGRGHGAAVGGDRYAFPSGTVRGTARNRGPGQR